MGVVADAVLAGGGNVHGVITRALERKEVEHRGLASLQVVDTMHERKAAMADLASAFVMLPGGYGTFDEFFEAVTWSGLGLHSKPCGILNVDGFFGAAPASSSKTPGEGLHPPEEPRDGRRRFRPRSTPRPPRRLGRRHRRSAAEALRALSRALSGPRR